MIKFQTPSWKDRCVELRFADGEVCIYATKEGLQCLSKFCLQLAESSDSNPRFEDHVHLEDYELLTPESLPGVIAVFADVPPGTPPPLSTPSLLRQMMASWQEFIGRLRG